MFEELFYERLVARRLKKGVSARDMSLSIGQSEGYINGIENRHGFPSMSVFFYICEYLGVTPSEFFDEGNQSPAELKELVDTLKTLDHEQLQSISTLVKNMNRSK